ncbi:MAG TPA: HAMP domain-containing sensor histidine kinase [Phenylobacterium sp.]
MADPARPLPEMSFVAAGMAGLGAPVRSDEEIKRAFLRMMSHELRTPLNSILGFSEILAGELYGPLGAPQYKEYAGIVRDSGQKLLELVNQMLELARLECGVSDLAPRAEPLDRLLDELLETFADEAHAGTLTIRRTAAPLIVMTDPRGFCTVLGTLVRNALHASGPDAPVQIELRPLGLHVDVAVRDTGDDVNPDDLPRLLRPFEQPEAGDGKVGRSGYGLSLPTSAMLCRAMGGELSLQSAPGAGLTAVVRLPLA